MLVPLASHINEANVRDAGVDQNDGSGDKTGQDNWSYHENPTKEGDNWPCIFTWSSHIFRSPSHLTIDNIHTTTNSDIEMTLAKMNSEWKEDLYGCIMQFIITQCLLKPGLKKFRERGEAAMSKELLQLHMVHTCVPLHYHKLTRQEKANAISSLMFLKEKHVRTIKGRACADGRLQQAFIPKKDAASPIILLNTVMITSTIEPNESNDIVILNQCKAFLHAENEKVVLIKMEGPLAEMMVTTLQRLGGFIHQSPKSILWSAKKCIAFL